MRNLSVEPRKAKEAWQRVPEKNEIKCTDFFFPQHLLGE